jgi:iron complex outermembrane receptor protein
LLKLQAATRIESVESRGTGVDLGDPIDPLVPFDARRSFAPTSASIGLLYQLPLGVVARLTGQYTERAPDVAELFSKGVHEATGTFEIGNPLLRKESARTVELGFKRARGAFRFDATAFHTHFDDFIFKRFTGVGCGDTLDTCGVEDELDLLEFAQRDATFRGVELSAQYDVLPIGRGVFGVEGQYDFVNATFSGGG